MFKNGVSLVLLLWSMDRVGHSAQCHVDEGTAAAVIQAFTHEWCPYHGTGALGPVLEQSPAGICGDVVGGGLGEVFPLLQEGWWAQSPVLNHQEASCRVARSQDGRTEQAWGTPGRWCGIWQDTIEGGGEWGWWGHRDLRSLENLQIALKGCGLFRLRDVWQGPCTMTSTAPSLR